MTLLAAYGTLMTGQANGLSLLTRARLYSLGPCRINGRMYRVWEDGIDYPGLIEAAAGDPSMVEGELFRIEGSEEEAASVLADIDLYEDFSPAAVEDSSYCRRLVSVWRADEVSIKEAWVYFYRRPMAGLELLRDGRWVARVPRPDLAGAEQAPGIVWATRSYRR